MTRRRIYHVADLSHWLDAQAVGEYRRSTRDLAYDEVGFVHCAGANQVRDVLDRFYRDVDDLVLLTIDAPQLAEALVDEPGEGTSERFPHLYRPLPVGAVTAVTPVAELEFDAAGSLVAPPGS